MWFSLIYIRFLVSGVRGPVRSGVEQRPFCDLLEMLFDVSINDRVVSDVKLESVTRVRCLLTNIHG